MTGRPPSVLLRVRLLIDWKVTQRITMETMVRNACMVRNLIHTSNVVIVGKNWWFRTRTKMTPIVRNK
jgi:hypothetical protein